MEDRIWSMLAYVARYGHQPLDILMAMPLGNVERFHAALCDIVREENNKYRQEDD